MIEANSDNYKKSKTITDVIDYHLNFIRIDSLYKSSINKNCDSFKTLVSIGDNITNYLFYLLFERGTSYIILSLLSEIIKDKPNIPEEHLGKIYNITVDWMNWYLNSDYYKNNNIYFNLI